MSNNNDNINPNACVILFTPGNFKLLEEYWTEDDYTAKRSGDYKYPMKFRYKIEKAHPGPTHTFAVCDDWGTLNEALKKYFYPKDKLIEGKEVNDDNGRLAYANGTSLILTLFPFPSSPMLNSFKNKAVKDGFFQGSNFFELGIEFRKFMKKVDPKMPTLAQWRKMAEKQEPEKNNQIT